MLGDTEKVSSAARSQPLSRLEIAGTRAEGELLGDLLRRRAGVGQCLAGGSVEVTALGGQHVAVDGLADEIVAEASRSPSPTITQPTMPPEASCDIDDRPAGDRGEISQRERDADQARQSQQLVRFAREPRQASYQRLVEVGRRGARSNVDDP